MWIHLLYWKSEAVNTHNLAQIHELLPIKVYSNYSSTNRSKTKFDSAAQMSKCTHGYCHKLYELGLAMQKSCATLENAYRFSNTEGLSPPAQNPPQSHHVLHSPVIMNASYLIFLHFFTPEFTWHV